MDEWMDRMALALGEEPLTQPEVGAILKLAREVAHGVERKAAPLATFLAGLHAGTRTGAGVPRLEPCESPGSRWGQPSLLDGECAHRCPAQPGRRPGGGPT